jgi:sporulation protein YlmC with PRC-barrel domain
MNEQAAGRELYAGLDLLDRQIVDCDGFLAGKVDDLELEQPEGADGLPVVVAILSGPGALARQLGGRLGRWLESVQERLHHRESPGPARIPFSVVKRINDHVEVSVPREALESNQAEEWARDVIIHKIPGSGHAPE